MKSLSIIKLEIRWNWLYNFILEKKSEIKICVQIVILRNIFIANFLSNMYCACMIFEDYLANRLSCHCFLFEITCSVNEKKKFILTKQPFVWTFEIFLWDFLRIFFLNVSFRIFWLEVQYLVLKLKLKCNRGITRVAPLAKCWKKMLRWKFSSIKYGIRGELPHWLIRLSTSLDYCWPLRFHLMKSINEI